MFFYRSAFAFFIVFALSVGSLFATELPYCNTQLESGAVKQLKKDELLHHRITIDLPSREPSLIFFSFDGEGAPAIEETLKQNRRARFAKITSYYYPLNKVGALVSENGYGHSELEKMLPPGAIPMGGTRYYKDSLKPEDSKHFGKGSLVQKAYFDVRLNGEDANP